MGELELLVPRVRSGPSYFPSFLESRRRAEQAIVAVVLEAYVNGVSTRKVDRLVAQLGLQGMSKDRVSALCRALDEQVEAFRQRPLEGDNPYLWLDAKQLKVRDGGHVLSKALVIAYAVHESGRREVIGLDFERDAGTLEREIRDLLQVRGCPHLIAIRGVGPVVAARILGETRGISRFRSAAAFAAHSGTAPVPASSGRTQRHRLNRDGNRQLNRALYTIAMVQARWDPAARAYLERNWQRARAPQKHDAASNATSPTSSTAPSSSTGEPMP